MSVSTVHQESIHILSCYSRILDCIKLVPLVSIIHTHVPHYVNVLKRRHRLCCDVENGPVSTCGKIKLNGLEKTHSRLCKVPELTSGQSMKSKEFVCGPPRWDCLGEDPETFLLVRRLKWAQRTPTLVDGGSSDPARLFLELAAGTMGGEGS